MRTISELRKSICADAHTAQEILKAMFNAIEQAWDCDKPIVDVEWYKDKFGDCHWREKRRENMEMTQYQKDLVRMWDSLRILQRGRTDCVGVSCQDCPLNGHACVHRGAIFNAEKAIEIVTNWAKDHPIVTNEDKFKKDWGCEPKSIGGIYLCPSYFGFDKCTNPFGESCDQICDKCKEKFWKSEYKEPKREESKS